MDRKQIQMVVEKLGELLVELRDESDRVVSTRGMTEKEQADLKFRRKCLRQAIHSLEDGQEALADLRERS